MVTSLLFGRVVVMVSKSDIKRAQAIEIRVYRYLLGIAGYMAIAALKGEIGASRMETRVMETVLMYAKDTLGGTFEKIKDYMNHDMETGKGEWIRTAKTYLITLNMTWDQLLTKDRK